MHEARYYFHRINKIHIVLFSDCLIYQLATEVRQCKDNVRVAGPSSGRGGIVLPSEGLWQRMRAAGTFAIVFESRVYHAISPSRKHGG